MFKKLRQKHNFDFIKHRPYYVGAAGLVILLALLLFFIKGLNLGIDFRGGLLMEMKIANGVTIGDIRDKTQDLGVASYSLQEFGDADILLLKIDKADDEDAEALINRAKDIFAGDVLEYRRVETVGPVVGDELKKSSFLAILSGVIIIFLYVWIRFDWQFALGGMMALFHDVIATVGLFALTGLEFNLTTIAALLTIAGYSINDTVVIYDRLRENLRLFPKKPLDELINRSINDTLSRTILTSFATLVSMLALALVGGSAVRDFGIALCFGIFVGTYSSIALALPMVALFAKKTSGGEEGAYHDTFVKK